MAFDKLIGFAPDVDPTVPGVFTSCMNVIPYESGFQGAPTPVAAAVPVLAAAARGAAVVAKLDDTRRVFAGTQTKLYELSGSSWLDRSAGGGSYTGSSESRWSFAQFGDTTVATNYIDAMQSSASGAFAAISGAPKALIVVSAANNFVLAFYTNEGTYGASPDRWWCCAQGNQNDWVPNVATGATTGRLIATPGSIRAALTLGDYVIAYKTRGIYLGSYVGSPVQWQWTLIPGSNDAGAVGQEAVCDMGGVHFLVGDDDFWIFDGTRPVAVGEGVREWFRLNSSTTYRYRTRCSWDRQRRVVWINYPSTSSTGALDRTLVWHPGSKRWGIADYVSEAALSYTSPGVTIDGLDSYSSTIDGLPAVGFDSAYWLTGGRAFAYFDGTHQLVLKNGVCGASQIVTGDAGDDVLPSLLREYRMRFLKAPTSAQATGYWKANEGEALNTGPTESIYDGRFDIWQSGRFHRLAITMQGDHRETAQQWTIEPDGERLS